MSVDLIVPILTALGTLLASPGILRALRVLGETRKAKIAAHVEEAKAPILAELDFIKAERAAMDDGWASLGRQREYFDKSFASIVTLNERLQAQVFALQDRVAGLEAEVKRLARVEESHAELEKENRDLRARVRELEAAA